MPRARSLRELSTLGLGRSREEIAIGAGARRIRRLRGLVAILGIGLTATAAGVYVALRTPPDPLAGAPVTLPGRCTACERFVEIAPDTRLPSACPVCGRKAVEGVWACRDCGTMVTVAIPTTELRCAQCGSARLGAVWRERDLPEKLSPARDRNAGNGR